MQNWIDIIGPAVVALFILREVFKFVKASKARSDPDRYNRRAEPVANANTAGSKSPEFWIGEMHRIRGQATREIIEGIDTCMKQQMLMLNGIEASNKEVAKEIQQLSLWLARSRSGQGQG